MCSPPPCGEGLRNGVASAQSFRGAPPSLTLPHKGGGNGETSRAMLKHLWRAEIEISNRIALLVPRLQIALAVIAALQASRRAVAAGYGLGARERLLATAALHQHAAALAVGDQAAFSRRLERLFAARCIGFFAFGSCARFAMDRPGEIRACERGDLFAELLAQHPGLDLLDLAFR